MNERLAIRVTTNVQRRYARLRRGAWRLIRRIKMLEEENAQAGAYAAILEKDVAGCVDAVNAATAQLRDAAETTLLMLDMLLPSDNEEHETEGTALMIRSCQNQLRAALSAQPVAPSITDSVRETLAEYAHSAWSRWMTYLFEKSYRSNHGEIEIPKSLVERWQRQMNTPYADLPESEKNSDRKEADKMLAIVAAYLATPAQQQPAAPSPDWSQAPSWANYYAVDADGEAFWYEVEPIMGEFSYKLNGGRCQFSEIVPPRQPDTLRQRPTPPEAT